MERLEAMGEWMKYNNRSVYKCTEAPSDIVAPPNTLLTYNPETKRLYVHLLTYPMGSLRMENMAGKVKYVQFLHDASEIIFSTGSGVDSNTINLSLPVLKPPVEIPVVEIYLK